MLKQLELEKYLLQAHWIWVCWLSKHISWILRVLLLWCNNQQPCLQGHCSKCTQRSYSSKLVWWHKVNGNSQWTSGRHFTFSYWFITFDWACSLFDCSFKNVLFLLDCFSVKNRWSWSPLDRFHSLWILKHNFHLGVFRSPVGTSL